MRGHPQRQAVVIKQLTTTTYTHTSTLTHTSTSVTPTTTSTCTLTLTHTSTSMTPTTTSRTATLHAPTYEPQERSDSDSDTTIIYDQTTRDSDNTMLQPDSDETVSYNRRSFTPELFSEPDSDETRLQSDIDETWLQNDNDRHSFTPELCSEPDSDETRLQHDSDSTPERDFSTPPIHLTDTLQQQFATSTSLRHRQIRSYNVTPPLRRRHRTQTVFQGRKRLRIQKRT